jgi:hypothetical protein
MIRKNKFNYFYGVKTRKYVGILAKWLIHKHAGYTYKLL